MELHSDRRLHFDAEPMEVWNAMGSVERYQEWWPWLRSFDATGLVAGDRWRCTVKPPLPYTVRFTVHLQDVVPVERIVAAVGGDIEGRARLDFAAADDGCTVHLRSDLAPTNALLRMLSVVGRPIARHGHDWVLDVGAGQFASRAL